VSAGVDGDTAWTVARGPVTGGVPVRDRVVQASLKLVLEPILEADVQPFSYGVRPGPRLAQAVQVCLDRGHSTGVVEQTMTADLAGARNPVAVALCRLRELAATAPDPAAVARGVRHLRVDGEGYGCGDLGQDAGDRLDRIPNGDG
jgi:hypothetical protein